MGNISIQLFPGMPREPLLEWGEGYSGELTVLEGLLLRHNVEALAVQLVPVFDNEAAVSESLSLPV